MAGTIIAASPLITRLEGQSLGYTGVTLSNFDNTDEPQIIGNFEIAGSIGSFASLESITGWSGLSNGTVYIKIVPDTGAGTCAAAFTDTAPTWDNTKMGWYGTGGDANHRYLFKLTKGGASLYEDKQFLEVNGKYQNVTIGNDLSVGNQISGSDIVLTGGIAAPGGIDTAGTSLITKVIDIGDWNMYGSSGGSYNLDFGIGWFAAQGISQSNVVNISVFIRNDLTPQCFPFLGRKGAAGSIGGLGGAIYTDRFGKLELIHDASSGFDSSVYSNTSFNRGYIIITYTAS